MCEGSSSTTACAHMLFVTLSFLRVLRLVPLRRMEGSMGRAQALKQLNFG